MNATNDIVGMIDSLMDELDQLANAEGTTSDRMFRQVEDTLAAIVGAGAAAIFLPGPGQTLYNASSSDFELQSCFRQGTQIWGQLLESADPVIESKQAEFNSVAVRIGPTQTATGMMVARIGKQTDSNASRTVMLAIAETLNRFFEKQQLKNGGQSTEYLQRLNAFTTGCLSTTDMARLAKVMTNDARLLLECERVQVFENRQNRLSLLAVSSVAAFEKRTELLRSATQLARIAVRQRKPVVSSQAANDKQASEWMSAYRDLSGMPFFAFLPLKSEFFEANQGKNSSASAGNVAGVLAIEFAEDPDFFQFVRTANVVVPHAGLALANAQNVAAIPFYKSLSFLGRTLRLGNFLRMLAWLILPMLLLGLSLWIQTDFKIRMQGTLRAVDEQLVFAPHEAMVDKVLVDHGDEVKVGDLLLILRSPELEQQRRESSGEIDKLREFQKAKQVALNQAATGNVGDLATQTKLASEIADIEFQIKSFENKRDFAQRKIEELRVFAPIDGKVVTWGVKNQLRQKPVRWGDPLLKIADETSDWELRFKAPEKKIGYIESAKNAEKNRLKVDYFFQSNPDLKLVTVIREMAQTTEMDPEFGPSVAIRCDVSDQQSLKRHGAKVIGDVDCGKRSLMFVWTYELVDAIRRQFVF